MNAAPDSDPFLKAVVVDTMERVLPASVLDPIHDEMAKRGFREGEDVMERRVQALACVRNHVAAGTEINADEALSWHALQGHDVAKRINHQLSYSDGIACMNGAEIFLNSVAGSAAGAGWVSAMMTAPNAGVGRWLRDRGLKGYDAAEASSSVCTLTVRPANC